MAVWLTRTLFLRSCPAVFWPGPLFSACSLRRARSLLPTPAVWVGRSRVSVVYCAPPKGSRPDRVFRVFAVRIPLRSQRLCVLCLFSVGLSGRLLLSVSGLHVPQTLVLGHTCGWPTSPPAGSVPFRPRHGSSAEQTLTGSVKSDTSRFYFHWLGFSCAVWNLFGPNP